MSRHLTFSQKLGAGFALTVVLAIIMGFVAIASLRAVVDAKDRVITVYGENLTDAEKLALARSDEAVAFRGFLIDKAERHLGDLRDGREEGQAAIDRLRARVTSDEERSILTRVERRLADHRVAVDRVVALRKTDPTNDVVVRAFSESLETGRAALLQEIDAFTALELKLRDEVKQASTDAAASAITLVVVFAIAITLLSAIVAFILTRTLGRQIGTAVGQVQSSSTELQAAASQQATGTREQSTAMNEITTTISELLATSRQIAESAQRVAQIANQTATSARSGDGTVQKANESIAAIRHQVDLIVSHMLVLGKNSQQIGAVLDIVSELAEQTNILAINATIEAAGAGDAGKRFAVVADEIRKLADRVAASTKDIRGLIEDVRGAVNTTVMTTETGSKAVDAGSRQFAEVASSFKQIAELVVTTTEAAREIELSTKQQTTAVEQVNVAIANVAQATKESEVSSSQTLQTASQLATLSRDLLRLVHPRPSA
ncbi:MAG: hypothetical protein EPO26_12470 [Chloroflexota bacterium]|nr:MAG: hypothetical protein EPO26_12470 [Chloroflexota bacterium]